MAGKFSDRADSSIKQQIYNHGFLVIDNNLNIYKPHQMKCINCNKIYRIRPNNLLKSNRQFCGHCDHPNIGDTIGNFVILNIVYLHHGSTVRARCECGNIWSGKFSVLNRLKSCGKCNNPKIGDKFGKLTVVSLKMYNSHGCTVNCVCSCGQLWSGFATQLRKGNTLTCGNCKFHRNGVATSNIALKLHNMIGIGIHNFKTDILGPHKRYINVDIGIPEEKIAIEYNEWYWHKSRMDDDVFKEKALLDGGWKLLIIEAKQNLPDIDTLSKSLELLRKDEVQICRITLNGWGI